MNTALSTTFTKGNLNELTRPCVYAFMRGDEIRYIGVSISGFFRFGSDAHHAREQADFDRVKVFWFDDYGDAKRAESIAIYQLKPPINRTTCKAGGWVVKRIPKTKNAELNLWMAQNTPALETTAQRNRRIDLWLEEKIHEHGNISLKGLCSQSISVRHVRHRAIIQQSIWRLLKAGKISRTWEQNKLAPYRPHFYTYRPQPNIAELAVAA